MLVKCAICLGSMISQIMDSDESIMRMIKNQLVSVGSYFQSPKTEVSEQPNRDELDEEELDLKEARMRAQIGE